MAGTLAGYQRQPGADRRYKPPKGKRLPAGVKRAKDGTISDRQYRKIVAAVGAKQTMSPQRLAKQVRAQRQYNRLLSQAAARARQDGAKASKADIRKSEDFKRIVRDINQPIKGGRPAKAGGARRTQHQEDRQRRALEALGYREGIPSWVPVGLSDRYRAGKLRKDRIPKAWRPAA